LTNNQKNSNLLLTIPAKPMPKGTLKSVGFLFMKYTKPALTISDQIKLLESRGLIISDKIKAEKYLANISYYRLSAYMYPFKDLQTDNFAKETTFENVLDLYLFDRELRLLVFDAIERIEISFRTQLIYQPAIIGGAFWFEDEKFFDDKNRLTEHLQKLDSEVKQSKEVFIKHFDAKYDEDCPPVWMSFEVISLGLLSKFYQNLKFTDAKKLIAKHYGLNNPIVLQSWIRSITYVRNVCAHHARLWNRTLTNKPIILQTPSKLWITEKNPNNEKLYYFLCCLWYLLRQINPETQFVEKLKTLFAKYPNVSISSMGFPKNWEEENFWN
jgi:abortive infection bacteriophage resistance protein